MGLRGTAIQGMRIQFYLKAANVLLNQLGAVALALLLIPRDFALFGLAMVFVGFGNTLSEFGIGSTLIQRIPEYKLALETGTTLRLLGAAMVTAVLVLVAPLIAAAYSEPDLEWVTMALSVLVVLNFAAFVPRVELTRQLEFRRVFVPEAVSGASGILSTVAFAAVGLSYWSLVLGALVGSAVYGVGLFLVYPWRPTRRLERRVAAELLHFGGTLTAGDVLFLMFTNVGVVVLGILRFQDVGYFLLAASWSTSIAMSLFNALDNVSFPVFSAMRAEAERVRRAYVTLMRYVAWTVIPLGAFAAVVAPTFVLAVLGSKWAEAIPIIQLLGLSGVLLVLSLPYRSVVVAVGRPREVLVYDGIGACAMTAISILLIWLLGAIGLALTFFVVSAALLGWALVRLRSITGPVAHQVGRIVAAPSLASMTFAIPVYFLARNVAPSLPLLALELVGCVAAYLVVLMIVTRGGALTELKDLSKVFIRG